jgi:nitrate/TMAO reductase-like tetraheme cytochrome c subunit
VLSALVAFALLGISSGYSQTTIPAQISDETLDCIECHATTTVGIYQEWGTSKHYRANVGCYECHYAEEGDPDAFQHNGYFVSIITSPRDCGQCHSKEVQEFDESHHAKAGQILGSLDNFLADIVEGDWSFYGGSALTVSGCKQCHGAVVEVNADGSLKPTGWPNTGMGRLNPDGSVGACSACHQRHAFSAAQARRPENCGKCHLGPDHPQKEIYEESKHGIGFAAQVDDLNLESPKWVLGEDYTAAPTCATCHMSAVRTADGELVPTTHDVGLRISWNNRPAVSIRPEVSDKKLGLEKMAKVGWETRRANMVKVCTVCHSPNYVDNFYEQYDGVINLYNSKFAEPGLRIMKTVYDYELITRMKFDDPVEWTWWELWHHEGRRARHGVSMMAPDYTHWHGLYDVAKHWYMKFIPELREIVEDNKQSDDPRKIEGTEVLEKELKALLERPEHAWYTGNLNEKERAKRQEAQEDFKERYAR